MARKFHRVYEKTKKEKMDKTWSKEKEAEFKEEDLELQKAWKRRAKKRTYPAPNYAPSYRNGSMNGWVEAMEE